MPLALQMGSGVVILVSNDQSSEQPAQEICSTAIKILARCDATQKKSTSLILNRITGTFKS